MTEVVTAIRADVATIADGVDPWLAEHVAELAETVENHGLRWPGCSTGMPASEHRAVIHRAAGLQGDVNRGVSPEDEIRTVQGDGVFTLTDTGRTFQLKDNLRGRFSFDPDDPALPTSLGHFVVQHRENVNYAQLKDLRGTDTQHSVVHLADGTSFPIQIRTTLLVHPDGSVEVKVDSLGCGGPSN